jgi:hypothetical protein
MSKQNGSRVEITCPECLKRDEPTAFEFLRREAIVDAYRIRSWPGVVQQQRVVHAIDAGGLLVQYSLREQVECSFPGGHGHKRGFIGQARCGVLLRIGHICVDRNLVGLEKAIEHLKASRQHFKRLSTIATEPRLCLQVLEALQPRARKYFHPCEKRWQLAFERLATGSAKELEFMRRGKHLVRAGHAKNDFTMIERETDFVARVQGIEFWKQRFTLEQYNQMVREADELNAADLGGLSETAVAGLARRAAELRARTNRFERWLGYGDQFFSLANYRAAQELARKYLH